MPVLDLLRLNGGCQVKEHALSVASQMAANKESLSAPVVFWKRTRSSLFRSVFVFCLRFIFVGLVLSIFFRSSGATVAIFWGAFTVLYVPGLVSHPPVSPVILGHTTP